MASSSASSVVGASDDTRFQFAQNEAVLVKDTTGLLEEALVRRRSCEYASPRTVREISCIRATSIQILNRRMEDDKPSYFVKFARWEDK